MPYTLIYVSETIDPDDQSMLDDIRDQAINLNLAAGITGLILHSASHFCQMLQGSKPAVEQTMQRIRRDVRHRQPVVILRTDFPAEMFLDWSMASSKVSAKNTVALIARAHTDRLARPEDMDHIVELMQQYRFGNHPVNSPVVSRTQQDLALSAISVNGKNEESLDSMLALGASMFASNDLLLVLKQPGTLELRIKTTASEIPGHLHYKLAHSQDQMNAWGAEIETGNGVQGDRHSHPKILSEVCSNLSYQDAVGYPIYIGMGDSEQLDTDNFLAASIWFLQKSATEKIATAIDDSRRQFVSCLEHLLEQQRLVLESKLMQRKAQRQQLASAANLERQHLVLNVASSAIIALDSDCRVLMINQSARELFSLQQLDIPFRWPAKIEFMDVQGQSRLEDSECPIRRAVDASRESLNKAQRQQTKDWEQLYENSIVTYLSESNSRITSLKCTAVAVNESDSAVAVVIVFDDITELERNRERIRRSDRLEALGHLTGGIAHDFNNLLATILNAVELASFKSKSTETQGLLKLAVDTVHRGSELTDRLVAFASAQPMKTEVHCMSDVLQAVEELAMASVSPDVELVIDRVPDSLAVLCDAGQLENALLNLLLNSRDAIVSSGVGNKVQVTVKLLVGAKLADSTREDSSEVIEIRVTDDGPGMLSADIQRATDPFFTTKESSGGSGLGLSMVYRFIQQSGGELLIDNVSVDEGLGSSGLCVRMLISQTIAPPANEPVPLVDYPVAKLVAGSGKTEQLSVLLVEDNVDLGSVIQESLEYLGYDVIYLSNAEEVLHRLQGNGSFDLLLTDVVMPGDSVDGIGLADYAKKLRPEIKIIYMSGYIQNSSARKFPLHGPILRKPISINELSMAIQRQSTDEGAISW